MDNKLIKINTDLFSDVYSSTNYGIKDMKIIEVQSKAFCYDLDFDSEEVLHKTHVLVDIPYDVLISSPGDTPVEHRWCMFAPLNYMYRFARLNNLDINTASKLDNLFKAIDTGFYKVAILEFNRLYIIGKTFFYITTDEEIVEVKI